MKIEIKSRYEGRKLLAVEAESLSRADLSRADLSGADLSRADLSRADLSRADLLGADLSRADLSGADLSWADLSGADLSGADLSGADLSWADLSRADLSGADLSGADLSGADLSGADLSRADLSGADLSGADLLGADLLGADLLGADLSRIKFDFFGRCLALANEVPGLRLALIEGRVDGSAYTGDCACFLGTAANIANCDYDKFKQIKPDACSDTERFFTAIGKGHTPENNPVSKIVVEWIDEFTSLLAAASKPQAA